MQYFNRIKDKSYWKRKSWGTPGKDANSSDTPEQQAQLYNALKEEYGESLPFVSDPELEMVERFNMRNGDTPYRGYGMLDTDGTVVFNVANDLWGEQLTETMDKIRSEYEKFSGK